ncbi:hypothetical protein [Glycomyces tenuis]|uniref:hypothetical protein n=1 Tax=Glycomyces tenuis TaxID=58116 RepID=UPI0004294055|nr:hypothetical protein [Glycomyces tenuis]
MTIDYEYLSDAQLDAIAAMDVNLADDKSIAEAEGRRDADRITQLEMDLEWTQRQREHAEQCEAFADAARRAAAERADAAETALHKAAGALADGWAALNLHGGDFDIYHRDRHAIADLVYEELLGGADPDDLDYAALIAGYLEAGR